MPIEIRELHIRIAVNAGAANAAPAQQSASPPSGGGASADKEAIVAECVEQVMQILQDKKER